MAISAIQVKGSRSSLQTGFSSFAITEMLHSGRYYVPYAYNPANDSSRGLDGIKSSKSQRSFKGPSFLSQPENQWPNQVSAEVSKGDPEIKPAVAVNVITIIQDLLSQLEGRISSWEKMRKVVAHILKLKAQFLQKIKQKKAILTSNMESNPLTDVELLQEASDSITKLVHAKHFKDELGKLK